MAVPPPSPDPLADKQALRATLRKARRAHIAALKAEGRYQTATDAAADRVIEHVPAGATVALFQPYGGEIDPAPLAAKLVARGHKLALPHVADDGTTMRFLAWEPDQPLFTGLFGLSQPDADGPELAPTLIVTPLVGFDRRGGRIGQGKGFYDRAFAALPGAIRIGLAWSVQEVPQVPRDPWDVPLHAVATEREWIAIGAAP